MDDKTFFTDIINNVSMGGLFVDRDRTIRDCNPTINRIFGYSREELLGKKTDLLYGDRRKNTNDKNEIYNYLETNGYHVGAADGIRKDGTRVPLNLYTFVIKKDRGAFVLIRDTRRSVEEESRRTSKLLQDLLDNIPDMIYFKDLNNRFILVNKAHARALHLTPEEVIGKSDLDFFPKEIAEKYFEDDNIILKTGKPVLDKIEKARRPDGGMTYVSTTKIPRFDENGRIIGTVGITRNVTERWTAEEELRVYKNRLEDIVKERTRALEENQDKLLKMYNMKSEFTSMVSHELRTPLTIIKDSVGMVSEGIAGPMSDKQRHFLDMASQNIDRLVNLINDLLDFSKLENKKMEFRMIDGNLNEYIDSVFKSYEIVFNKRGVRHYINLDPSLPLVRFDPDRITQVLHNLINNAIKFTDKGYIKIESKKADNRVIVSVEDTGIGIKKEDLHRVFGKFEQIPQENGKKAIGTGLGLAICKQIIEHLGGRIWADSEYGKGSKFLFSLPIK